MALKCENEINVESIFLGFESFIYILFFDLITVKYVKIILVIKEFNGYILSS